MSATNDRPALNSPASVHVLGLHLGSPNSRSETLSSAKYIGSCHSIIMRRFTAVGPGDTTLPAILKTKNDARIAFRLGPTDLFLLR